MKSIVVMGETFGNNLDNQEKRLGRLTSFPSKSEGSERQVGNGWINLKQKSDS
jgi:hypothetical protein